MGGISDQTVFQRVGEWPMANIMKQNGNGNGLSFLVGDFMAFGPDYLNGLSHKVHGTYGMLKSGVVGAWINKMGHTQLSDSAQTLKHW